MDKIFTKYEKQANFYTIYIREAHPTDGWRMQWNDRFGIKAAQPKTFDERSELAAQCSASLQLLCPMLVDTIDDKAARAYAAFPDRLYLIDSQGRVAYKGGRGPFGYKPRELESSLLMLLMDEGRKPKADEPKAKAGEDKETDAAKDAPKKKPAADESSDGAADKDQ